MTPRDVIVEFFDARGRVAARVSLRERTNAEGSRLVGFIDAPYALHAIAVEIPPW